MLLSDHRINEWMNCVCVRACVRAMMTAKWHYLSAQNDFGRPLPCEKNALYGGHGAVCLSVFDLVSATKLANFHENHSRFLFQTVEQVTFRANWPSDSRGVLRGITEFVVLASSSLLATVVRFQFWLSVQQFVQIRVHTRVSCESLWHSVNKDSLVNP